MNTPSAAGGPARFRCKVGGEWKDLSQFSNAQQKNLRYLTQAGRPVDAAHSGMTCKQHSAGPRSEMQCDVCMLIKPLNEFSKNSRRNGESQCRRCVAWTEIQEPSLTPGPLETGHISPEEEQQQMLRQRFTLSEDFFSDDDLAPQAPITAFASLGLDESYAKAVGAASISELLSRDWKARHDSRDNSGIGNGNKDDDKDSSAAASTRSMLPPHLRAKYKAASEAASTSAQSTVGDMSLPTTLLDSDSDAASIANRPFNAWGPNGEMERRHAGSASSAPASSSAAVSDDPNVVGDWSHSSGKLAASALPRRGRGGWPKIAETRLSVAELRRAHGDVHQTYFRREIDVQRAVRPLGYGDSDDSD
ncbi:hypothetical protein V2A60_001427 [Cordyceps javanica]